MTRRRVAAFSAVVVVAVCVVLAAPVLAYVARATKVVKIGDFAYKSATAVCPKGEHVEFGGIAGNVDIANDVFVLPEGMRRTAPGQWSVYAQNAGFAGELKAFGYCGHGVAAPFIRHSTASVPSFSVGSATATCPSGSVVVGAGFLTGGSVPRLDVLTGFERTSDTKLRATMVNLNSKTVSLTAIVYCGPGPAPTLHGHAVTIAANHRGVAHASCPSGSSIVFGGFLETAPDLNAAHAAAITPFRYTAPSDHQWDVSGSNGGDRSGVLKSLAYCR